MNEYVQEEGVALQEKVRRSVKELEQKAIARRQEEALFVLSVAHEKGIRDELHSNLSLEEAVTELLQEGGEEELVEEECLKRYSLFLESKRCLFSELALLLKRAADTLPSDSCCGDRVAASDTDTDDEAATVSKHSGAPPQMQHLWHLTELLYKRTAPGTLMSCVQQARDSNEDNFAAERRLAAEEQSTWEAVKKEERLLAEAKARVEAAEHLLASLAVKTHHVQDSQASALERSFSGESENAITVAQYALDALNTTTQRWIRQRKDLESTRAALRRKLDETTQNIEASTVLSKNLMSSAKEMEDSTKVLKKVCSDLVEQKSRRERQCIEQERILEEQESNYARLKDQLLFLADREGVMGTEQNHAEFELRKMCSDVEELRKQVELLKGESDAMKATLDASLSVRAETQGEVDYLLSLIPDSQDADRALAAAANRAANVGAAQPTSDYFHFYQRARHWKRIEPHTG